MSSVISQDPEALSGESLFAGTSVPVRAFFDHLESGASVDSFLKGFPSVRREQVIALLEDARRQLVRPPSSGKRSAFPIFSSRSPGALDLTPHDFSRKWKRKKTRAGMAGLLDVNVLVALLHERRTSTRSGRNSCRTPTAPAA